MRTIAAYDLAGILRRGQTVFVVGSSNEPVALIDALAASPEAARGLRFLQFPLPGMNTFDFSSLTDDTRFGTFFLTPDLREGYAEGRIDFYPMHMRNVYDFLHGAVDVAMIQVAFDRTGSLRIGPNVDFAAAVLESADVVIAELNRAIRAPLGAPRIAESAIDFVLESNRPIATMAPPVLDDVSMAIGGHVAGLINDGDCLQTGIGSIPAAILKALADKNDIGMHGGLIDDGGRALIESGVLTGREKNYLPAQHVAGMVLGSRELYEWVADRADVVLASANVTHETRVISRLDRFVSINSAVEVDLDGQVNAEVVAGRQISGTGGAVDFMRGARMSAGGRSIVAMTATARRGQQSRIVTRTPVVTALRTDVDIVVTEFGVARLTGTTQAERRERLIAIAHPDFRDELQTP